MKKKSVKNGIGGTSAQSRGRFVKSSNSAFCVQRVCTYVCFFLELALACERGKRVSMNNSLMRVEGWLCIKKQANSQKGRI